MFADFLNYGETRRKVDGWKKLRDLPYKINQSGEGSVVEHSDRDIKPRGLSLLGYRTCAKGTAENAQTLAEAFLAGVRLRVNIRRG